MNDPLVRVAVIFGVVAVGAALGWIFRGRVAGGHPPLILDGLGLPAGVIVFTSTECAKCKETLEVVKEASGEIREVTWELEPGLQEGAGVKSVPLTVVTTDDGQIVAQFTGVPSRRRLRHALKRAGR